MAFESGIRPQRMGFVRETTAGTTPADPAWLVYSDSVQSVTPTATASINPRGNVGSPDIAGFVSGTESHEFQLTYDLQRWPAAAGDASYDGMVRDADGELPATHSVLIRDRAGDDGTAGGGAYIYTVITGAKINTVNFSGEPESGDPIMVNLSYLCENLRTYKIDQPASSGTLDIVSTSASDTMNIDLENDGATTTEQIALNGTTPVTTTASFASLDAAWLASAPVGDVTISDGSNDLMVIYGSGSYNDRPGERGVPLLGSGSHGSAIGSSYEVLLGDTIERPGGTAFMGGADISSFELTVENNLEAVSTVLQIGKKIAEGPRTITLAATIFGEKASYDSLVEHLQARENNIVWTLSGGTFTIGEAAMTEIGNIARETDQAVMTIDNTFQGKTLTIS